MCVCVVHARMCVARETREMAGVGGGEKRRSVSCAEMGGGERETEVCFLCTSPQTRECRENNTHTQESSRKQTLLEYACIGQRDNCVGVGSE